MSQLFSFHPRQDANLSHWQGRFAAVRGNRDLATGRRARRVGPAAKGRMVRRE